VYIGDKVFNPTSSVETMLQAALETKNGLMPAKSELRGVNIENAQMKDGSHWANTVKKDPDKGGHSR
jgi:hypothetical protein